MVPLEVGALWAMGATLGMAMAALVIKMLTRTEPAERIVFWTNVGLTVGTLGPALAVWQPMTLEMWIVGAGMGFLGAVSHIFLTKSFAAADASIVIPFDYARLPFIAVVGYVFFAQTSDLVTWIGAAVIAGSAFYVARREQQLAKRGG
jgi:drug/metabolite transporter (DMT)-like permease